MSRGKVYKKNVEMLDRERVYSPIEAINILKEFSPKKFDETVEVHFNLGIDPRHADQQLRGTFVLPCGTGAETKVLVFADGSDESVAKKAGADFVGSQDLVDKIQKGWLGFDIVIATPKMMGVVGKLGRILGSKGMMPNPKTGTVTTDIEKAVKEFKSGRTEYRNDKGGNVHLRIGKLSFDAKDLLKNFDEVYTLIEKIKPSKAKGVYVKSITLCSAMSPGISIEGVRQKWEGGA